MTELILMPMSWLVSKSLETARMAMPILVYLIMAARAKTSTMVRIGVTMVTILVVAFQMVTELLSQGMLG